MKDNIFYIVKILNLRVKEKENKDRLFSGLGLDTTTFYSSAGIFRRDWII